MDSKQIYLLPDFELFFTFPFCLGFSIEHSELQNYISSLDQVANFLNKYFSDYTWSIDLLNDENKNLPNSIKAKGAILTGKPLYQLTELIQLVDAIFNQENIGATFNGNLEESVVYFTHGVGSVNFNITGKLNTIDAIPLLQKLAMAIYRHIAMNYKYLYIFNNWESFQIAMCKSFESSHVLYDIWGILSKGGKGRGPTLYIGNNVILRSSIDKSFLSVNIKDVPKLLSPFTGLSPEKNINLAQFASGLKYLAEGWDGQIAIVSDSSREQWLKYLWQFAADYGALLHDLDRYLYLLTCSLCKESLSTNITQSKIEREALHRIQVSIELITHETIPYNFGGIIEEIQVFQGIYESWEMKKLAENLRQKSLLLDSMSAYVSDTIKTSLQDKIRITMLILTIVTISSVIATIIYTVDYNNIFLHHWWRLLLIISGTIGAALLFIASLGLLPMLPFIKKYTVVRRKPFK